MIFPIALYANNIVSPWMSKIALDASTIFNYISWNCTEANRMIRMRALIITSNLRWLSEDVRRAMRLAPTWYCSDALFENACASFNSLQFSTRYMCHCVVLMLHTQYSAQVLVSNIHALALMQVHQLAFEWYRICHNNQHNNC